jgi:hypothetical protein
LTSPETQAVALSQEGGTIVNNPAGRWLERLCRTGPVAFLKNPSQAIEKAR